jgi:uncharacterized protein (DUF2267 family)
MTTVEEIDGASELFLEWIAELKDRSRLQSNEEGLAAFCSVIQCLRQCMTTAQVLSFADALPPLQRGIFIGGWRPAHELPSGAATTFLHDVIEHLSPQQVPDTIVADVFALLAARAGPDKSHLMQAQLPDSLRNLWP